MLSVSFSTWRRRDTISRVSGCSRYRNHDRPRTLLAVNYVHRCTRAPKKISRFESVSNLGSTTQHGRCYVDRDFAPSPYTLYAFVNLVRLIINEERSNNSIVSNPCSVPMNNRNDVYGLNRCERFNSWVKIECSGGSRVVSRLFYYLSDAMRANARQKVSSTAHKIGSGRDAGVINLVRSLGKGGGFACYGLYRPEISCRRLVSRETLPSRVAMLPRSDKNRVGDKAASWKKGCGERVESGGGEGGGEGGAGFGTRERKRTTSGWHIRGQLSNKQTSPPLESKLAGAVPTFVISRDILRLPTRSCRYPMHTYIYPGGENSRGNAKIHPIYRLCLRTSSN